MSVVEPSPAQAVPAECDLTIGMPVYNAAAYLEPALRSLLEQSDPAFRLVISDNGSTDDTVEIIHRVVAGDPRVTLIEQPQNKGVIANFRAVLDASETRFFMWAAGDDVWDREWVAVLLPMARRHGAVAFGQITMINADGSPRAHPSAYRDLSYRGPVFLRRMAYFLDPGLLGRANPIYGIMDKTLITPAAFAQFATPQVGPDVMFLYEVLKHAPILCLRRVSLQKRHHAKAQAVQKSSAPKRQRFRRTQLLQFWAASTGPERVGLIVLYPAALVMTYVAKIRYLLTRRR